MKRYSYQRRIPRLLWPVGTTPTFGPVYSGGSWGLRRTVRFVVAVLLMFMPMHSRSQSLRWDFSAFLDETLYAGSSQPGVVAGAVINGTILANSSDFHLQFVSGNVAHYFDANAIVSYTATYNGATYSYSYLGLQAEVSDNAPDYSAYGSPPADSFSFEWPYPFPASGSGGTYGAVEIYYPTNMISGTSFNSLLTLAGAGLNGALTGSNHRWLEVGVSQPQGPAGPIDGAAASSLSSFVMEIPEPSILLLGVFATAALISESRRPQSP